MNAARAVGWVLAAGCTLSGGLVLASRGAREAKAALAERLIETALDRTLREGGVHKPWEWADHHPLARLDVPRLGVREPILSGATGGSLAFGLGHIDGTAFPGRPGHCVVAAHRDRQGAFLAQLRPGDDIIVTTHEGAWRYRVESMAVVEADRSDLLDPRPGDALTLVTCWPFDGITRTHLRYAAFCRGRENNGGIRSARTEPGLRRRPVRENRVVGVIKKSGSNSL